MRQIMRKVSAKLETDESELRLLPQPLYRYSDPNAGVTDGALFGYVMGTDPELFAIVEARDEVDGLEWQWAFARFTHVGVTAKLANEAVFQCRHRRDSSALTKYFVLFNAEYRPATLEESREE